MEDTLHSVESLQTTKEFPEGWSQGKLFDVCLCRLIFQLTQVIDRPIPVLLVRKTVLSGVPQYIPRKTGQLL